MKHIYLIDPGHGGFIDGVYQTAPRKMYQHSPSEIFYEGLYNRKIADLLMRKLWEENIPTINLAPSDLDIPLLVRANIANSYYEHYRNAVLLSLHSNSGGGAGFEVFTSPGPTYSDHLAQRLGEELIAGFQDIPFRADTSDGDLDKEEDFTILTQTYCPAVLVECLFFDNYNEYLLLEDADFRLAYVRTLVNWIKKVENE